MGLHLGALRIEADPAVGLLVGRDSQVGDGPGWHESDVRSLARRVKAGGAERAQPFQSSSRRSPKIKKGGLGRPRRTNSECYLRASGDLVKGRVGDLISLKLRSSLDDLSQRLQLFRIARAVVGFCVL